MQSRDHEWRWRKYEPMSLNLAAGEDTSIGEPELYAAFGERVVT